MVLLVSSMALLIKLIPEVARFLSLLILFSGRCIPLLLSQSSKA